MGTLTLAYSVLGARGSAASRHLAPPVTLALAPPSPGWRGRILWDSQGTTARGGVFDLAVISTISLVFSQGPVEKGEF